MAKYGGKYIWERPAEVFSNASLWGSDGISGEVSQQGYDGDCWFLSTASALAAYPQRIKNIFPGQDSLSEEGVYQVRLFVRGEPVNVIVDDRMPVKNHEHHGKYTWFLNNRISSNGATWLMILEKAMAKLNGNYLSLNGGRIYEAMRFLTGQPTAEYYSNKITDDQLWTLV